MHRRTFCSYGLGAAFLTTGCLFFDNNKNAKQQQKFKGNIKHSVARWCFDDIYIEDLILNLKEMGVHAVDLVGPKDWPLLKKHQMHCSMCNGAEISLTAGWNDPTNHSELIENYLDIIPKVSVYGFKNLICFSGNRNGMDDELGLYNCAQGLRKIMPLAEKYGVVIQMELFNQQDHPDYMCDNTKWGVALCDAIGSDHFKLLYDIYHMQIQEGNIIDTIRKYHPYFGHYHTAGVPGRAEIDDTQELNYKAIVKAIVKTGFDGYLAQEFVPKSEHKISSLKKAFFICDV